MKGALFAFMLAAASVHAAEPSRALLRKGGTVEVTAVSAGGITVAPDSGPARVESLSRIRGVSGPLSEDYRAVEAIAKDLWRATTRLERGDEAGSEPLFQQLWQVTEGVKGPTRAEIAAGLLTCLLRRGAAAAAIAPWIEWLGQAGTLTPDQAAQQRDLMGISDPVDFWIAELPPVWTDSTGVARLAERLDLTGIGAVYVTAARRDTGRPWGIDPAKALKDPAWTNLAGLMVLAEAEDAAVRAEARQRLSTQLGADSPLWKQCWIRLALGRSLLLESANEDRRQGILNLLWIGSRSAPGGTVPARALSDAARGLVLLGDLDGAGSVLEDLERRFSDEAILDSAGVAAVRRAVGASSVRQRPVTEQAKEP